MKSLSSLYLEYKRIERVISWMHPWPSSLKRVSINDNSIPIILPIPKQAVVFNLEGNPTYCGCRPEKFTLNDISKLTLCKVRMQCNSIKIKSDCKKKQISEVTFKFWKDIAAKPICRGPVIKELLYFTSQERFPYLICLATGVPAPNVTLYSGGHGTKGTS